MKKETRNRIEKVLNYAKENNCSVKEACTVKNYNYSTLMNTIKYTRSIGKDEDIISLYDSVKKPTSNSVEHIDTNKSEIEFVRDEDGKILNYKLIVYRKDKSPFYTNLSRLDAETIFGLYTYYGGNITARNVANEFPKYTLNEIKYIFRAFGLTKDSMWAPKHLIEELTIEELNNYRLNLKEKAAFKYADSRQERDYKNLLNRMASKITNLENRNNVIKELITSNINISDSSISFSSKKLRNTCILYLSDIHVGSYNEKQGYIELENYNKEEIIRRLNKALQFIMSHNYDKIIVVNLGDSVDSYNKQTTRGGHELPSILSNKEQSQLYLEIMLWFFSTLSKKYPDINYYCTGESNHDGDWGWLNNVALAAKLDKLGIKSYISNNPIDKFDVNDVSIAYLHGKDISNQFKGFPLTLNDKTINWFNTYFVTSKQSWKNKICVVKGDLHQPAFTNCNTFDYYSCPSVYGSSQYIVANFGKTNWGVMYMNIDENNNISTGLIND